MTSMAYAWAISLMISVKSQTPGQAFPKAVKAGLVAMVKAARGSAQ